MIGIFDDFGIRFEYPLDWELEVSDDGDQATVSVQAPGGLAFALIRLDAARPAPAELADEALAAMRAEYPGLDAEPALETIDGQKAIGHDLEFLSLDLVNACVIRCFQTPRRTVFVFEQWTEHEGDEYEMQLRAVCASIAETDA
jgi:hypothetical protein